MSIAEAVEKELGTATFFLDEWFEHFIAVDDADLKLQNIYPPTSRMARELGINPWYVKKVDEDFFIDE